MNVKLFSSSTTFAANTYVLLKDEHALIVDLGFYNEEISQFLRNYVIDGVILTHKHFDHINGLELFQKEYPNINIYSKHDSSFFVDPKKNFSLYMSDIPSIYLPKNIMDLNEGEVIIGKFKLNIIYTPGHSKDCISFIDEDNNMFVGDFIFPSSIGRLDLYSSNKDEMISSLKKIIPILKLREYMIYSGHDKNISSSLILKVNAYLKAFDK